MVLFVVNLKKLNTQVDSHKAFEVCGCYSRRNLQCLSHFWSRILNDSVLSCSRES